MKRRVAVFGGSGTRPDNQEYYFNLAYETGKLLAQNNYIVITGAGPGLMDETLRGAIEAGGETIGVYFNKKGRKQSQYVTTPYWFDTLRPRQKKIIEVAEACIALPGGIGTLYEFIEVLALKKVGDIPAAKPLILLNDYYDNLNKLFQEVVTEGFAQESLYDLYFLAKSPTDATSYINTHLI